MKQRYVLYLNCANIFTFIFYLFAGHHFLMLIINVLRLDSKNNLLFICAMIFYSYICKHQTNAK